MTVKEKLHRLVNGLPEANSSVLNAAEHYLEYLAHSADPVALANAEVIIREWIETAQELGRPIPMPRGRLLFA